MECLVDTPNTKLSLCQTSVVFGWCLFAVDSSSSLDRRRFFYFFRMMKKTNTRREGTLKTWEKNISKVTRKKRRGTPKTDTKKTTDDLLERVALVRSIDRSIDRLLPPPSTEYTAIDKSPNLGIFFFLTRPCENARGVRVERATVVLWCLFSK